MSQASRSAQTSVIYCRISLDRTGEEAGVDRQEAECRALAEKLGLEVTAVYVDNSISAFSGKHRPDFERLLVDRPAAILTWHEDRLMILSKDLERVIALGVNVHTVMSGRLDLSNPAGRAVARTVAAWGQYERELKGERQKAAHRQRKAAGKTWWSVRPFGYTSHGKLVATEAAAIREVYRRAAAGDLNMARHARWLTESGFMTTGKARAWGSSTVRGFLLAERNLGGPSWESLIDEATWTVVRDALLHRSRAGGISPIGMLTGIAVCGVCGSGMVTATPPPHIRRHIPRYYRCHAAGHVNWPKAAVDEIVGAAVAAVIEKHRMTLEAPRVEGEQDTSQALHRLALDFAAGRLSVEEFTTATEREKDRAARLSARPREIRPWSELTTDVERRTACLAVIEKVVLPSRGAGRGGVDPAVVLAGIVPRQSI
jgi:site-specific DNA recombinase